jgi:tetrapyrrole methylase family protein/MazG family protein
MTAPSPRIVIVGLGPGNAGLRTLETQRALHDADRIVLRTRIHPGIEDLTGDPRVTDCDDLYETIDHFDRLYPTIAQRVIDTALTTGAVVFAVPGHPRVGERTVPLVEMLGRERGIPVVVLDAVSFVDAAASALHRDPLAEGLQIADAEQLAATLDTEPHAAGLLGVDPARPLLVGQVYNAELAAAVKLALARVYPDDHPVALIQAAGTDEQTVTEIALHALDRQPVDYLTSLWVPPLAALNATRSPHALERVVARLRAPGGCPWDREQTHASLRDAVLEEAYEAVDAIDGEDAAGLAEELGDLLLLIAMHAQLAEEVGDFRIEDVYQGITEKLIRRHPHVFGTVAAETPDAVIATWEGVKAAERAAAGAPPRQPNPVDRLPRAMPALRKAAEVLAPRATLAGPSDEAAGDALLAAVQAALDRGIDPERALEQSLRRHVASHEEHEAAVSARSGQQLGEGQG